jgi:hypothetical protein
MTELDIPNCIFCGSPQSIDAQIIAGLFAAWVVCENGGCAASGPVRESETKGLAEQLAVEAYARALKTDRRLDLDRRAGVGHNTRAPGGRYG